MDDLISRQWLMECVNEGWIKFDTEKDANTYIHLVRDIAPSVQLERKRGHWIEADDSYNRISGRCSVCGWESHMYEDDVVGMNFCPNCGADMRERDEQKSDDGI